MKGELLTVNYQLSIIDAVVLANGEYPVSPLPLKILAEAPYVVCCDGGADEYIRRGHTPDVIIGDGDSLSKIRRICCILWLDFFFFISRIFQIII